nr:uncharacterized protein LOC109164065 [Ipomoea batatas]
MMAGASDAVMCRSFIATLDGQAQDWFTSLPERSFSTFADIPGKFLSYYASSIPKKKEFANMSKLEQWNTETLTDYLTKWKKDARSVENLNKKVAIPIFTNNVRSGPFHRDLVQNPSKMYAALLDLLPVQFGTPALGHEVVGGCLNFGDDGQVVGVANREDVAAAKLQATSSRHGVPGYERHWRTSAGLKWEDEGWHGFSVSSRRGRRRTEQVGVASGGRWAASLLALRPGWAPATSGSFRRRHDGLSLFFLASSPADSLPSSLLHRRWYVR